MILAALLLASLFCVGFARQSPPERARWEYKMACGRTDLNKLGDEGWELVAATQDGNVTCVFFKRPK